MTVAFTRKVSFSDNVDRTSYPTSSWTPTADEAHLACVVSRIASGNPNIPTLSGNGLTWVRIDTRQHTLTSPDRTTSFYAIGVASPSAGALTADFGGQTQDTCIILVDELVGANDGSPVNTSNTQNAVSGSTDVTAPPLLRPGRGSAIWAGEGQHANTAQSAGSGFTSLGSVNLASSNLSALTEYDSTGLALVGEASSAVTGARCILVVEVKIEPGTEPPGIPMDDLGMMGIFGT